MKRIALLPVLLAGCGGLVPTSADILPADTMIAAGNPVQFEVEVRDQNGDVMLSPEGGKWVAVDGPVEVSATGIVTGAEYGIGMVEYRIEDVVAKARVRINPKLTLEASLSYVNQAIQNPEDPIPLIPGRDGLLRLFVAVDQGHFYRDAIPARIQAGPIDTVVSLGGIPKTVNESDFRYSFNAMIPGAVIEPPEIEVRVTYDPEDLYDGLDGEETLTFEVLDLPRFDLMVVPTVSSMHPRPDISQWARDGLTFDHDRMWATKKLLPVATEGAGLEVHEVLEVDYAIQTGSGWVRWLNEMGALRNLEGRRDYYLGVMKHAGGGIGGIAYVGRPAVVASDNPTTMSHEMGHGMSLQHAPCNVNGDPNYPHDDGEIGQWGIDVEEMELKPPHFKDHMGYCFQDEQWTSDFFFAKALRYRDRTNLIRVPERRAPVLLVWGNISDRVIRPAFAAVGTPSVEDPGGRYVLRGLDAGGETVFDFRFTPDPILHLPNHEAFSLAISYDPERDGELAEVLLLGPGVEMALKRGGPVTVIERGPDGQVLSIRAATGSERRGALVSDGLPVR